MTPEERMDFLEAELAVFQRVTMGMAFSLMATSPRAGLVAEGYLDIAIQHLREDGKSATAQRVQEVLDDLRDDAKSFAS